MKNTSANIVLVFANEIIELSNSTGVSRSNIVIKLLRVILGHIESDQVQNVLTEYQRIEGVLYKKVDYVPDDILINKLGRVRWEYRISISKLIGASFLLFWDVVVAECYGVKTENEKISLWDNVLSNYEQIINKFRILYFCLGKRLNIIVIYNIQTKKLE